MPNVDLIQTKFNTIYEYYRDETGKKKQKIIDFLNYFYVKEEDFDKVMNIIENSIERSKYHSFEMPLTKTGFKSIYNDDLVKIYPNKWEFWKVKKLLKEKHITTYEFDLDVYLKYLLNNINIKFTTKRRLGIIDIETDMCLDAVNTPEIITSITVYDYQTDKYHTWILKNELNQEIANRKDNELLYIFDLDKEKEMLLDFIDKIKIMDFDMIGGWNAINFDWPYILNRMKRLDININRFNDFGEDVEIRSFKLYTKKGIRDCFDIKIPGLELVDFIPVLAKNTCYSPQPSSWSLESVCKFYLDDFKLVKIGPESWKTDINKFVDYNIKDVELVKKIVDKFRLLDFLISIQTDVASVPLNHTTHNSVVLLYYLKFLFPEKILRDNPGYINLQGDEIYLKDYRIRMKAAHVIPAIAGIHENVSIFDFAGLYPTIFRTFNISPETISNAGVEIDDVTMWKVPNTIDDEEDVKKEEILKEYTMSIKYNQSEVGVYPKLLKNLTDKRKVHKNKMNEYKKLYGVDDIRTKLELFRQDVLKQINNSLYGVGGFNKTILFNPVPSASVTSISRKLIKFIASYVDAKEGFKMISGDTDSGFILHPKDLDITKFSEELNVAVREYVFKNFPNLNKDNYCLEFEYAKTFSPFVMKEAKKKYYGVIRSGVEDGKFYAKGFDIIQHVLSKKIKNIIQNIFIMLMEKKDTQTVREKLKEYKKEFLQLTYEDLGQELKLAGDPDKYTTNVRHARAAEYSNKYLKTNFKAGSSGKLLFIKNVVSKDYPFTDIVFIDEMTELPNDFIIDYELSWQKLVLDKIQLLDSVEEMNINELLNPNKSIFDFCSNSKVNTQNGKI